MSPQIFAGGVVGAIVAPPEPVLLVDDAFVDDAFVDDAPPEPVALELPDPVCAVLPEVEAPDDLQPMTRAGETVTNETSKILLARSMAAWSLSKLACFYKMVLQSDARAELENQKAPLPVNPAVDERLEEADRLILEAKAPAQRSCVILKDVLGHSVEEIVQMLELTIPAVKAALHRGRTRLRSLNLTHNHEQSAATRPTSPSIARYAVLFNSRDWDGVRVMLAEDVKLDLVSHRKRAGKRDVGGYYLTQYGAQAGWRLVPAWLQGREVLAAFHSVRDGRPGYFIELALSDGLVTAIRDFRFVPYIANDAAFELADS